MTRCIALVGTNRVQQGYCLCLVFQRLISFDVGFVIEGSCHLAGFDCIHPYLFATPPIAPVMQQRRLLSTCFSIHNLPLLPLSHVPNFKPSH